MVTNVSGIQFEIVPSGWSIEPIGELSIEMADGPFGSNLKKVHYTEKNEVRIIQLSNIGANGWNDENKKYTTFEHARTISRSIVLPNNVVIAKMMPAGQSIICPNKEKGYILSSDAVRITFDENKVLPIFFVYSTKTRFFKRQMSDEIQGSTRARTSITKLKLNRIVLPPVPEQTAIATTLSDIDTLIENLEKLIAKKRSIKQGAMQELLTGKKRLEGFSGELEYVVLGEKSDIFRGGSPRPIQNYLTDDPNGVNWIKIGDVKESAKYIKTTSEKIKQSGIARSRQVFVGDFVISNSMSFGRPYILKLDGCIHDGWLVIQNYEKDFEQQYLYYILSSDYVKEQYISMAAGSSVQNLSKDKVAAVVLPKPSKEEQRIISTILSDMDTEITELEQKLHKYNQVKLGMMDELLTGRIRLIDIGEQSEEKAEAKPVGHNKQFDDAVMIAGIVDAFYHPKYYLGRKKVQKLLYLVGRKNEQDTSAFHKHAAGPYADSVRYKGGEPIAKKNKYISETKSKQGSSFAKGENIGQALQYITDWGKQSDIDWLTANLKFANVNELEVLATVDMAMCDLRDSGTEITVDTIITLLKSEKAWVDKLKKDYFSKQSIESAIEKLEKLFA